MPRRLSLFTSHFHGEALLRELSRPEHRAQIVLIATDDPRASCCNARGRLWRYWSGRQRDAYARLVPDLARALGLVAFTGRVRPADGEFRRLFAAARPDAIIASIFGQRLPRHLLDAVDGRAWNLHPVIPGRPLAATGGPQPIETALALGASSVQMCLHRMGVGYDDGPEVARSGPFTLPAHRGGLDARQMLVIVKGTAALGAGLVATHLASLAG